MTTVDALLSLGLSIAANKITDIAKPNYNPDEAIREAYSRALNRWAKNDGARDTWKNRFLTIKDLFINYLKGRSQQIPEDVQELIIYWLDEMRKCPTCAEFLRNSEFICLMDEIGDVKQAIEAGSNGISQILKRQISQDSKLDEIIINIHELLKQFGIAQELIHARDLSTDGFEEHEKIANYISRTCYSPSEKFDFFGSCVVPDQRKTLLEYIQVKAGSSNNENHFVLYSSGQTGKSTELKNLAYELQESGLYHPILFEIKHFQNLNKQDLPNFESKDGKPIVVIIDALDEAESYRNICSVIDYYVKKHPSTIIVVSCRSNFKTEGFLDGFTQLELAELSWNDIETYIRQHAKNHEQLIANVREPKIAKLVCTPFILINIVELFGTNGKLPQNKIELFEQLIRKTDNEVRIKPQGLTNKLSTIIAYYERLAIVCQMANKQHLSQDDILLVANKDKGLVSDAIKLNYIEKDDKENYFFIHNAFKEYFAALFLSRLELKKVQQVVCYKNSTEIKDTWYEVLLMWVSIISHGNIGLLQDIIDWLRKDAVNVLINSDYSVIDEGTRFDIFKEILEDMKSKGDTFVWDFHDTSKHLMNFGESDQAYEYFIRELQDSNQKPSHIDNIATLSAHLDWYHIHPIQEIYDKLVQLLTEKIRTQMCGDEYICDTSTFLRHPFFNDKIDEFLTILRNAKNTRALYSTISLIEYAHKGDEKVDFLLEKESLLSSEDKIIGERFCLNKALQQVSTLPNIIKVLRHISTKDYMVKNRFDSSHKETEQILLVRLSDLKDKVTDENAEQILKIFNDRETNLYPIVYQADMEIVNIYQDILKGHTCYDDSVRQQFDDYHLREPDDEQRKKWKHDKQDEFDRFCDHDYVQETINDFITNHTVGNEIDNNLLITKHYYIYRFIKHDRYFPGNPNVEYCRTLAQDINTYEAYRMYIIAEEMLHPDFINVSDGQKQLCLDTARTYLNRLIKKDYQFSQIIENTVLGLIIHGELTVSDDELKVIFSFSSYSTQIQNKDNNVRVNKTIFDITREQLGEVQFTSFILCLMKETNLNIPELQYLQIVDFIVEQDSKEGLDYIFNRILNDDNPDFVHVVVDKLIDKYSDSIKKYYTYFKHDKVKYHILDSLFKAPKHSKWAITQTSNLFSQVQDEHYKHVFLFNLCSVGDPKAIKYLNKNLEMLGFSVIEKIKCNDENSLLELTELLLKLLQKNDGWNAQNISKAIVLYASTSKEALDWVITALDDIKEKDGAYKEQIENITSSCRNAFRENDENKYDILGALGYIKQLSC